MKHLLYLTLIFFASGFTQSSALAGNKPIKVADLTFQVVSTGAETRWEKINLGKDYPWPNHYYGFREGDEVLIDLKMKEGDGTYNLEVRNYESGALLFSKREIKKLRKAQVTIPARGVYNFIVISNTPQPTTCELKIYRIPAPGPGRNFNTNVTWQVKTDTVYKYTDEKFLVKTNFVPEVLVDKTFRVFSKAKIGSPSRVTIPFKVPADAAHWVYWVGVGQESAKELEELTKTLAKGSALAMAGVNPVAAFGMGLIPALPQIQSSGYVDFLFLDPKNEKAFREEGTRKPLPFAKGDAIISAYGKISTAQLPKELNNSLYLGIENTNSVTGLDVAVKLMAFLKEPVYETRRVKKFDHLNETRVPVFGP